MPHRLCQAATAGLVIGHKAVMHTVRRSGAFVNLLVCCVAAAYTHKVGLSSIRREGLYAKAGADTISKFFSSNDNKVQEYYKAGGDRKGAIQDAFVIPDMGSAARTVFTILVSASTQKPLQRAPFLAHPLVRLAPVRWGCRQWA